ncbi:MAG: FUSC family protein [Parachlamydiaceae bacterium]
MKISSIPTLFSSIEGKVAVKTSLAAAISLFLGTMLSHFAERSDVFISGLWTVQAAIVVQQAHLGSTYRTAWMRFLGAIIGCFFGGLMATLLGSTPLSLGIAIFSTVVLCSFASLKDSIRIACLSVAIVMVLQGIHPTTSPWVFSIHRFLDSCVGILIAIVIAHTLWPARVDAKIGQSLSSTLQNLSRLFNIASTLNELSSDQIKDFRTTASDTHELFWKNRQILEDSRLELLTKHSGLENWKLLFVRLEEIYESIFSLSKVYRKNLSLMIDPGIEEQFRKITTESDRVLLQYALVLQGAGAMPDLTELQAAIKNLDTELLRYRETKATRAYHFPDVEGFFVFFYTLKAVAEEIERSNQDIASLTKAE